MDFNKLRGALSGIAEVKKSDLDGAVFIDIEKIMKALSDGADKIVDEETTKSYATNVSRVSQLIDALQETDDGRTYLAKDHGFKPEFVETFKVDAPKTEKPEASTETVEQTEDVSSEESEEAVTETTDADPVEKGEVSWDRDMSPERLPLRRSERAPLGETPIGARRGSLSQIEKVKKARDKHMLNRGNGRQRSMS